MSPFSFKVHFRHSDSLQHYADSKELYLMVSNSRFSYEFRNNLFSAYADFWHGSNITLLSLDVFDENKALF